MRHSYITQGGMAAYVAGCAYAPRPDGGYALYSASLVGPAREGLRAIWAGLVDHRPHATALHLAAVPPDTAGGDGALYAADRAVTGGLRATFKSLPRSAAHHLVLLPASAWADYAPPPPDDTTERDTESAADTEGEGQTDTADALPLPPIPPFVLLDVPTPDAPPRSVAGLFATRLTRLALVGLDPQWADWLWQTALAAGWATPLRCYGDIAGAWVCTVQRDALVAALGDALRRHSLPIPDFGDALPAPALLTAPASTAEGTVDTRPAQTPDPVLPIEATTATKGGPR